MNRRSFFMKAVALVLSIVSAPPRWRRVTAEEVPNPRGTRLLPKRFVGYKRQW